MTTPIATAIERTFQHAGTRKRTLVTVTVQTWTDSPAVHVAVLVNDDALLRGESVAHGGALHTVLSTTYVPIADAVAFADAVRFAVRVLALGGIPMERDWGEMFLAATREG